MTPQIVYLTDAAKNDHNLFLAFDNESQAIEYAIQKSEPFVYKLPRQNTWLVAVVK